MNLEEVLENKKEQKRILENFYNSPEEDYNLFYANNNIYCYDNNKILLKNKSKIENREQRIKYIDNLKKQYDLHFLKEYRLQTKQLVLFYQTFLFIPKDETKFSIIDTEISYIKQKKNGIIDSSRYMFSTSNSFEELAKRNLEIVTQKTSKFDLSEGKPEKVKLSNEIKYKRKNTTKLDLVDKTENKQILPLLKRFQNIDME